MATNMKLRLITETIDDVVQAISQSSGLTPEQIKVAASAPSPKYWKWTLNQWHKGNINPSSKDVAKSLQELFDKFEVISKLGPKTDINTYKTAEDLKAYIALANQRIIEKFGDGAKVLYKHDPFIIYAVSDVDALKLIGEGSKWCTRGSYPDCAADSYIYNHSYVIVITKDHKPYIQFTPNLREINWADNKRMQKSLLEDILNDLGTSIEDILEKASGAPSITEGASEDAITLYKLTKCVEEGTYNSQLETPLTNFLQAAFSNYDLTNFGILFDQVDAIFENHNSASVNNTVLKRIDRYATQKLKVRVLSNGKAMDDDVKRALNNIVDMVCEFVSNRPSGPSRTPPYPSLRKVILDLSRKEGDLVSRLAGAYDTNIGRFIEDESERAEIRNIAAKSIEGIIELKNADGARVPEGERNLLAKALSDIKYNKLSEDDGEVPYFRQNFDNLIDYYEVITNAAHYDPNSRTPVRKDFHKAFRWPEYEKILLAYPVYSPSFDIYKSNFTTMLNSLTSYMAMNEITTADLPQAHATVYRYLQDLCRLYYEDRAQLISRDKYDVGLAETLMSYLGLAATESDANQLIALFNQYPQVVNDQILETFISSISTADRPSPESFSRFMTMR